VDDRPYRISAPPPDPAVAFPYYRSLADAGAARRRFEDSAAMARLWPRSVRERTLEAFDHQRALDGYLLHPEGGLVPRLEALLLALTRTSSRTLALWLVDTQESEVRIAAGAEREGATGGRIHYLQAADALARRDYAQAASRLAAVRAQNPASPRLALLHVMALHLAGSPAEATGEAEAACPGGSSPVLDAETCSWIRRRFPAGP
jgi:hypothetical protein